MENISSKIEKLVEYVSRLDGDEKGEAQVFCDRLFQAFGHEGYKEAGATLEFRVKSKKSTRFADLLWGDRVLLEMKKRGAKLESHRAQVFDYWWKLRPNSPQYVVLCNFDEFYIYDFTHQDEPLDRISLEKLPERYTALNFLFPKPKTPVFENNVVDVTREAANAVAKVYNQLIERGEEPKIAQRFILQCVFAMFAEDFELLPRDIFTTILRELLFDESKSSYDLIGGLFNQMASEKPARAGRYANVPYFNGGLFDNPDAIELNKKEVHALLEAAKQYWGKVNPSIFGTIFQSSMGEEDRHAYGAHFTSEVDIYKVVHPCIIQPWLSKIERANTLKELRQLLREIRSYRVLDPACGSGNFLYIAFRELKRLEMEILNKIYHDFKAGRKEVGITSLVSTKQFFGIDKNSFAVELARVTLLLGKEIAAKETGNWIDTEVLEIGGFKMESTLPLDNLDDTIIEADALFTDWPEVEVIIGNPPFQSKNKMQEEYGPAYVNQVHNAFSGVPGRADFCVYWFHKAHTVMKPDSYAGLVGTNTIRQNYSREGGLDYIVQNGGEIFNAVSSQVWSGDAVVFVSIVNWKKGVYHGKLFLYGEDKNGEMFEFSPDTINSSLSFKTDVSSASTISINKTPKAAFQGQTHGHSGFLLKASEVQQLLMVQRNEKVLRPFLNGTELVGNFKSQPERFVIDFSLLDVYEAATYEQLYKIVATKVLPDRERKAKEQEAKNSEMLAENPKARTNKHHINFFNSWWQLSYGRKDMLTSVRNRTRYIACSRVSARPFFEFISSEINPSDALMIFSFEDDYSFGIIQSKSHIEWYKEKGSSLKGDFRYTTDSIWDTFPWPQNPSLENIQEVSRLAKALRDERNSIMQKHKMSLRDLYRIVEQPGKNPVKDLHNELDKAVIQAYGFNPKKDLLTQLLNLNLEVASKEEKGEPVQGPGLPDWVENKEALVSEDCVTFLG